MCTGPPMAMAMETHIHQGKAALRGNHGMLQADESMNEAGYLSSSDSSPRVTTHASPSVNQMAITVDGLRGARMKFRRASPPDIPPVTAASRSTRRSRSSATSTPAPVKTLITTRRPNSASAAHLPAQCLESKRPTGPGKDQHRDCLARRPVATPPECPPDNDVTDHERTGQKQHCQPHCEPLWCNRHRKPHDRRTHLEHWLSPTDQASVSVRVADRVSE